MLKDDLVFLIEKERKEFTPDIEESKGMRFWDNDRVFRQLRMDYFHEFNLKQLPDMESFVSMIDDSWARENVKRVVRILSRADYHYQSREKWT